MQRMKENTTKRTSLVEECHAPIWRNGDPIAALSSQLTSALTRFQQAQLAGVWI